TPQHQRQQGATPAAAEEAEGAGRVLRHPIHYQGAPARAQAGRGPARLAQQGWDPALLEALLPAGQRPAAAEQDGGDQSPGIAVGQKQNNWGPRLQRRVGGATYEFQLGWLVV